MMSFWVVPWSDFAVDVVLLGDGHVERQQPGRGGVDRHRRVHLAERDAVEQLVHVALVGDRDADLADLAARELVVGVVAGLGGEVERDREAGLALLEVLAVEGVRLLGGGVAGVGPHDPRPVAFWQGVVRSRNGLYGQRRGEPPDRRPSPRPRPRDRAPTSGTASIVDPGPASSVETLLEACPEPRALLLTHIHLDHAGATGVLVRRFPDLKVYVHERGRAAPDRPVASCSKSAGQLYGDDMDRLWGEVAAGAGGEHHRRSSGGETVEGLRGRVHARPRVAPRLLLRPGLGRGLHRRRRGRAHPAERLRAAADAAAGHRRRAVARRRSTWSSDWDPTRAVPDPRRAGSTTSSATWTRCASDLRRARASRRATATATRSPSHPRARARAADGDAESRSATSRPRRPTTSGWGSSATGRKRASASGRPA